jgi:hypothetical protein
MIQISCRRKCKVPASQFATAKQKNWDAVIVRGALQTARAALSSGRLLLSEGIVGARQRVDS